jgi:hypothetical protein
MTTKTTKTPRELLRETLERNAKDVALLPSWLRAAISTEKVFSIAPSRKVQSATSAPAEPRRS